MVISRPAKLPDNQGDILTSATVIMEVLPRSIRNSHLGDKFANYRLLSALVEYVVVQQTSVKATCYLRQPDGSWLLRDFFGTDAIIDLRSIGCKLNLGELYKRVVFAEDA
jgi:Uma2 family endonuclease